MCEFLSWVEKGNKLYYQTRKQIDSPKGDELKRRFHGEGKLIGHAAIRAYYDIDNGSNKECTDFSSPANFPLEIAQAIVAGKFNYVPLPRGLLREALYADYWGLWATPDNRAMAWQAIS